MGQANDNNEQAKIRVLIRKVAEFIAVFESAEEKLEARTIALDKKIIENEERIQDQIAEIRAVLQDFQEIMTEAGAARWRLAAENSLKAGEDHLNDLRQVTQDFLQHTEAMYHKLERASEYTVKGITNAIQTFKVDEFQDVANTSIKQIRQTCNSTLNKVREVMHWFHWRNIGMILSMTILVTMVIGLYLNDEWPWETHREVMQQRNLAHAVATAWPQLTKDDQQVILRAAQSIV